MWEVEYTNEFGNWWESLTEAEQVDIAASIGLLEELGPNLRFPHSSGDEHLKELNVEALKNG